MVTAHAKGTIVEYASDNGHGSTEVRASTPAGRGEILARVARWTIAVGLMAVLGLAGWVAHDMLTTRAHLDAARAAVVGARLAAERGDQADTQRLLHRAGDASIDAARSAHAGLLDVVAGVPGVGDPVRSVQVIADVLRGVASDALPPAGAAASALTERPLLDGGAVDVDAVAAVREPLSQAQKAMAIAVRRARAVNVHTWVPAVNAAGRDLLVEMEKLQDVVRGAETAVALVPDMLGRDGRRSILVALQNNAEARGTGGLVGGLVLLTADKGRITADRVVKDLALPPGSPVDLGGDYERLYGQADPTQIWQNSNLSPHFPYAARIWRSLARQLTGVSADVVIGMDPVGIRAILGATGPIDLPSGETVTPENVVELTESTAYSRFADDRSTRKNYLADIADAMVRRITTGRFDAASLAGAFAAAINDDRVAAWSGRPDEQVMIAATRVGHEVPYSPVPYAGVVVNNSYASKLDYYLARDIRYRYGICANGRQRVRVDVTLLNNAPRQQLSPEVLGTYLSGRDRLPALSNRVTVSLYASWGSTLINVAVDGRPTGYGSGRELGHPVTYVVVTLPPTTPVTIEFELDEPMSSAPPAIPLQPLTNTARLLRSGTQCAP